MTKPENEQEKMPTNLVGTRFVKLFREYLLSLIKQESFNENEIVKKAYLEKDVKPDTTKRYLRELEEMEIIEKNKNNIYLIKEG